MDLYQYLHDRTHEILQASEEAMSRSHLKNYEREEPGAVHQRLRALYVLTIRAVKERNLGPLVAHADMIARERFAAGYDLWEVQTAFNVLEEVIWMKILKEFPPVEYAEALGLVSTVLGTGKDTLARKYVTLASKARTPTLNLKSLFTGTERQEE
jgi:hypothetical protein